MWRAVHVSGMSDLVLAGVFLWVLGLTLVCLFLYGVGENDRELRADV